MLPGISGLGFEVRLEGWDVEPFFCADAEEPPASAVSLELIAPFCTELRSLSCAAAMSGRIKSRNRYARLIHCSFAEKFPTFYLASPSLATLFLARDRTW